ncbi:GRAM domain-containing protein 4-like isoform X1 [Dermacentor albipictus]|uniref:GRAM domain-containing protein 4-like isoform X1 n=1 Tax=Dermacentor albipictus TaxID=60249 RepID=UPI0031FC86CE
MPAPPTTLSDTSACVEPRTGDMPTVESHPKIEPPPRKRKTSQYLKVPSLQVPLKKSMKNLSCPDLTKLALQNGGTSEEDLQRAPSLGDSIGDTMSLHSDQCTEDELQFAFKNPKLLRTNRYGEDSDSSDCSHLEMMPGTPRNILTPQTMLRHSDVTDTRAPFPVSDDDALHSQSDKSSQNDSSSPKLMMKRPTPRQRRKAPAPQSPLVQNSAGRIPSIKVTCETPALRSSSAEKLNASDWAAVQLTTLKRWFAELQDDFSEWHPVEVPDQPPKDNDESFSLKYTKDTLFRFACVDCSLRAVQHELTKLLQWKSPLQTLLVVAAILHGLWNDCLLTLVFVGVALGLIKNYLGMKGFLGSATDDVFTTDHKKLGIGMGIDKVPAIMSLNMKIAKTFHVLSDAFDKGLSLWTWRKPAVTAKVLGILGVLALYSMIRPTAEVIKVLGTALVLKAFILDYVFVRFPRVRAKYDLAWILWNELPTGPEIEKQARVNKKKEKLAKKKSEPPLIMINNNASESRSQSPVSFRGDDIDEVLSSIFNIPTSEMCLQGWEQGRKCTLIKKERSLTSAFRNGRLYLTDHYLLFLRYKTQHPKNLTIHLSEISKLEKGKTASWISGDGASLIVTMKNGEVYTFGTVANREETFQSIVEQGMQNNCKWASIADLLQSKTS